MAEAQRLRASTYGWAPLMALAATMTLTAGENTSLSQAVNGIQRTFHVSNSTVGLLPVAVSVVAVAGAPPFGFMADRRKRTLVLAGAILTWAAFEGLNGLAWGFGSLLAFRLGVGFAEASSSASISLIGDYWPVDQRAMRMGWYSAGGIIGALVGFVGGGVAVSLGGWRWAFWFWVPLGVAVAGYLLTQPEPTRGHQDADFEADRVAAVSSLAAAPTAGAVAAAEGPRIPPAAQLPAPRRIGTLDYRSAGVRDVMRELFRIPSMWWALVSLTVAQCLASALGFWAIPFFERVDHLKPVAAGAFAAILLPTAIIGALGGGAVADRLFRRGVLNARVHVVVAASLLSAVALPLGFATHNLIVSAVFLTVGGCSITLPLAPSEALFNDVVVADLRGRAASVRSMVRAVSSVGSLVVGIMADHLGGSTAGHAVGLQHALVIFAPVCGLAGVTFLFAGRSYAHDLAFVCAETTRLRALRPEEWGPAEAELVGAPGPRVPGPLRRRASTVGGSIASAPTGGTGKEGVPGA